MRSTADESSVFRVGPAWAHRNLQKVMILMFVLIKSYLSTETKFHRIDFDGDCSVGSRSITIWRRNYWCKRLECKIVTDFVGQLWIKNHGRARRGVCRGRPEQRSAPNLRSGRPISPMYNEKPKINGPSAGGGGLAEPQARWILRCRPARFLMLFSAWLFPI